MNIATEPCQVCKHDVDLHRGGVCGDRDCSCLCFLPDTKDPLPAVDLEGWGEAAMTAVLDLIIDEEEGTVEVDMKDGRFCRIKVTYVPGVGYSISSPGGRA